MSVISTEKAGGSAPFPIPSPRIGLPKELPNDSISIDSPKPIRKQNCIISRDKSIILTADFGILWAIVVEL